MTMGMRIVLDGRASNGKNWGNMECNKAYLHGEMIQHLVPTTHAVARIPLSRVLVMNSQSLEPLSADR